MVSRRADAAARDARWAYVQRKQAPRWRWHALDHRRGTVLADVLGRRQDAVLLQRKALLEPLGSTRYDTDSWGASPRHLDVEAHEPGQRHTHKMARKPLTLRPRITRLVRTPICCSQSIPMHDLVLGWLVNRYEFELLLEGHDIQS